MFFNSFISYNFLSLPLIIILRGEHSAQKPKPEGVGELLFVLQLQDLFDFLFVVLRVFLLFLVFRFFILFLVLKLFFYFNTLENGIPPP